MPKYCSMLLQVLAAGVLCWAAAPAFSEGTADATAAGVPATARDPDGPVDGCARGSENKGFFSRLKDSYKSHLAWDGPDPNAPPTKIVGGAEIPMSNPPWPYSTWNIGGSEAIGVENMYYSALM